MSKRYFSMAIVGFFILNAPHPFALTVEQFSSICNSVPGECSDHPIVQAYIGGALDLLATLKEETNNLDGIYCKEPKELFKVPTIIRFMQTHREGYGGSNAMLLVVRYFEESGGCKVNE